MELIDLLYNVNAPVDGEYYAVRWNLPKGRPGYADVYEPYAGPFNPSATSTRKRLGRWREDKATQPAFDLARKAKTTDKKNGVYWQMIYTLSRGHEAWVYFDAASKSYLDRATLLLSRSVLGDSIAGAVASQASTDKLFVAPPPEEGTGRGVAPQGAREIKPSVWARIPTPVKVMGAAAAGAAAAWLLG
jgi:hypothetical protein